MFTGPIARAIPARPCMPESVNHPSEAQCQYRCSILFTDLFDDHIFNDLEIERRCSVCCIGQDLQRLPIILVRLRRSMA